MPKNAANSHYHRNFHPLRFKSFFGCAPMRNVFNKSSLGCFFVFVHRNSMCMLSPLSAARERLPDRVGEGDGLSEILRFRFSTALTPTLSRAAGEGVNAEFLEEKS
jgi:hypothetical protein